MPLVEKLSPVPTRARALARPAACLRPAVAQGGWRNAGRSSGARWPEVPIGLFSSDTYFAGSRVVERVFSDARGDGHAPAQPALREPHVGDFRRAAGSGAQEPDSRTTEDRLREVMRLKEAGLLTDEEYRVKRAEILGDL